MQVGKTDFDQDEAALYGPAVTARARKTASGELIWVAEKRRISDPPDPSPDVASGSKTTVSRTTAKEKGQLRRYRT
jgi:hypothetical protein